MPCKKVTVPVPTGAVRVLTVAVNVTGTPGLVGLAELLNCVAVTDWSGLITIAVAVDATPNGTLPARTVRAADDVLERTLNRGATR